MKQMLELADKDFQAVIKTIFKDVKKNNTCNLREEKKSQSIIIRVKNLLKILELGIPWWSTG